MDFVETAIDPWGRTVLTRVAWSILWVSVFLSITFLVAHASYVILSAHRVRGTDENPIFCVKITRERGVRGKITGAPSLAPQSNILLAPQT